MKRPNWRSGPIELIRFAKKDAAVVAEVAKIADPAFLYNVCKRLAIAVSDVPRIFE